MTEHIKISDIRPWVQYVVPAGMPQANFDFAFPIFQEADLEVYLDGTLLDTGYTVQGAGQLGGGQAVLDTPAEDAVVTLRRRLTIERLSDFQESGEFRAKVINDELDYQTAALQQVAEDGLRSLRLDPTDFDAATTLPVKAARAGRVLGFDPTTGAPSVSNMTLAGIEAGATDAAVSASAAVASAANAAASEGNAAASASAAATSEASAAASAAGVNMPPVTVGDAGKAAIVKSDGSGWETTAAVLGDAATKDVDVAGGVQSYDADTAKTDVVQTFTKAQRGAVVTLNRVDGTVPIDLAEANNFFFYIDWNATLGQPTNVVPGQGGVIWLRQNASTPYTLAYHADWHGSEGVVGEVSSELSSLNALVYEVTSAGKMLAKMIPNIKQPA